MTQEENLSINEPEQTLLQIFSAFPSQFDFYHLGKVEQNSDTEIELEEKTAIAFTLHGDMNAVVILAFPNQLDVSTYSELGNILVSKIANQLGSHTGIGVMISPPHLLDSLQLKRLLNHSELIFKKTYAHFNQDSVIPLETWVLPTSMEGIGYA